MGATGRVGVLDLRTANTVPVEVGADELPKQVARQLGIDSPEDWACVALPDLDED